jgi:hypothetical protein
MVLWFLQKLDFYNYKLLFSLKFTYIKKNLSNLGVSSFFFFFIIFVMSTILAALELPYPCHILPNPNVMPFIISPAHQPIYCSSYRYRCDVTFSKHFKSMFKLITQPAYWAKLDLTWQ